MCQLRIGLWSWFQCAGKIACPRRETTISCW
jgi:hypothetical protein